MNFKFGRKYLLKKILRRYLPENLISHSKKGFVYPSSYFSISNNKTSLMNDLSKEDMKILQNEYSLKKFFVRKNILDNFLNK